MGYDALELRETLAFQGPASVIRPITAQAQMAD
jgi:hypothetical protein